MKHLKRFSFYLGINILSIILGCIWNGPLLVFSVLFMGAVGFLINAAILTFLERNK